MKVFRSRRGTAEIVGSVLFLVILLFFFSNVFLWYNNVARQMNMYMWDKLNSAVGLESTVYDGISEKALDVMIAEGSPIGGNYSYTHVYDGDTHDIEENQEIDIYVLSVNYTFNTEINTIEERRLTRFVRVNIYAQFVDIEEGCDIFVWDFVDEVWIKTGHNIVRGSRWFNLTFSPSNRYIDDNGEVWIKFRSEIQKAGIGTPDNYAGTLMIDYMAVSADPYALKAHALGGREIQLLRLWIVEVDEDIHTYIDIKYLNILINPGSYRWITFGNETLVREDGTIKIGYQPPSGEVRFKIVTNMGNMATTSYDSTSIEYQKS